MRRWVLAVMTVAMTTAAFVGCRRPTTPEQAFARFVEALESRNNALAWKLLSRGSQASWNKAAALSGSKSGAALFRDGAMWQSRELRPNPDKPAAIKGSRAWLHFFDSLNQHVKIALRKEKGQWRIHLRGAFLAGPAGMPGVTTRAPAPAPQAARARAVARPAAPAQPASRRTAPRPTKVNTPPTGRSGAPRRPAVRPR